MRRGIKITLLIGALLFLCAILYFFLGQAPQQKNIIWGVNFSQQHADNLGLDWKKTYTAILDDLEVKNIKLIINWDRIHIKKDDYYFNDLDWQIQQAEEYGVKVIMVIGMKTGRWPECHIPEWVKPLPEEDRQTFLLNYLEKTVRRYKDSPAIFAWQIENEPFFSFGECPKINKEFIEREIRFVKSLDDTEKPVIISDSGEASLWLRPAKIGDIVGVTMYRKVWFHELGFYFSEPFPPLSYWLKARIVKWFYNKDVQCVELQAEPWGPVLLYDLPLEEQQKTMNLEKFGQNIEFAKKTGFKDFYLWGAEWWYWLKEKHNDPAIWNEAKKLFVL